MLVSDGLFREDGADNRGQEEGYAVDGDAVKEEDDGCGEHDGVKDAKTDPYPAKFVDELGSGDAFGLEARNGKLLLGLSEPECGFRTVWEGEEAYYAEDSGRDACNEM